MKTYTYWDVLLADPRKPLPKAKRDYQINIMRAGLASMKTSPYPSTEDWRSVSDAVNIMETLIKHGPWIGCDGEPYSVEDGDKLIDDAIAALAEAGIRHQREGKAIRLSGPGMQSLHGLLDDYEACINSLSERSMVSAHFKTQKRVREIQRGKRLAHDVVLVSI